MPGHRARAERRLRRRRRDRVPAARRRAARALRPQARAVRLAAREPVRRERRHGLVAAPPRQHEALLQRDRGRRAARRHLAPASVPRAGADHPVLDRHARVREVHRRDRGRGHRRAREGPRRSSTASTTPPVVRDALAELPYEFVAARSRRRDREAARRGGLRRAARARRRGGDREHRARGRRRPLGRAGARAARAVRAREPRARARACRTSARTSGSTRRAFAPFDAARRSRSSAPASASGRRPSRATSRGSLAATDASSSWRWAAAGRPSPRSSTVPPTVDGSPRALALRAPRGLRPPRDGALAGVPTVGCRRCGGGLAGAVGTLERRATAPRVAAALDPDLVVFDGSGAALPPIAADRTIVVVGGHQDAAVAAGYLNAYRAPARRPRRRDHGRARTRAGSACADAVAGVVRPGVAVVADDPATAPARRRQRDGGRVLLHGAGRARTPPLAAHLDGRSRRPRRPRLGQPRRPRAASSRARRTSTPTSSWSS